MKCWHSSAFPLCCHCCFLAMGAFTRLFQGSSCLLWLQFTAGVVSSRDSCPVTRSKIQELNNCSDAQVDVYREGRFFCFTSKQAFVILLAQNVLSHVASGPWLSLHNLMLKKTQLSYPLAFNIWTQQSRYTSGNCMIMLPQVCVYN